MLVETRLDRRYLTMPHAERGMVVGLFGGSFNPPHAGHALVAEIALRRLGLDQLWWMVTPGNPLKSRSELASLEDRIAACERLVSDPRIKVTALKIAGDQLHGQYACQGESKNPHVRFIWIMGADNLKSFHRWQQWRRIAETFPIAVIDRPGSTLSYLSSTMAQAYSRADR